MEMNEEGKRCVSWEDNKVGLKLFKWFPREIPSLKSGELKEKVGLSPILSSPSNFLGW